MSKRKIRNYLGLTNEIIVLLAEGKQQKATKLLGELLDLLLIELLTEDEQEDKNVVDIKDTKDNLARRSGG